MDDLQWLAADESSHRGVDCTFTLDREITNGLQTIFS